MPPAQAAYVGLGPSFFQQGAACGRCIKIQCDDVTCASPGSASAVVALVVDLCGARGGGICCAGAPRCAGALCLRGSLTTCCLPACPHAGQCFDADLSIATPLFRNISGRDPGANPSVQASWQFLSPSECKQYISGSIKMLVKPGGGRGTPACDSQRTRSCAGRPVLAPLACWAPGPARQLPPPPLAAGTAYYQAFSFSNTLEPIVAVQARTRLPSCSSGQQPACCRSIPPQEFSENAACWGWLLCSLMVTI